MVKNLPANAGDSGDSGLIPGSGRSPGGGNCEASCSLVDSLTSKEKNHENNSSTNHSHNTLFVRLGADDSQLCNATRRRDRQQRVGSHRRSVHLQRCPDGDRL